MSDSLRSRAIRLAHQNPELRPLLLPLLKTARRSFEFKMSMAMEHDMSDAARMDGGGEYEESYVDLLRSSLGRIEFFLDGEKVRGTASTLSVKKIETRSNKLLITLEASPPPVSEEQEEIVLYGAEKLLKVIVSEEFRGVGGDWMYQDPIPEISVEIL